MNKQIPLQLVLVTGLSGAGKSTTIHHLEDSGYFCMDNVPPSLLPKFIEVCHESNGSLTKIGVVIDARGGSFFKKLFESLEYIMSIGVQVKIMFLEADDDVLVRRFSETRRKHPLHQGDGRIIDDIRTERELLAETRKKADVVIDTSALNGRELQDSINKLIQATSNERSMSVVFVSFGFKHGIPLDCDLIFDVRFLPNPFYIPELKNLTGCDKKVYDHVVHSEKGAKFANKLKDFIDFIIPNFIAEPKTRLQIGIGCTGGRHRSVAFTEFLFNEIKHKQIKTSKKHRDLGLV